MKDLEYWKKIYSEKAATDIDDRLVTVCIPAFSPFANTLLNHIHVRAFNRLIAGIPKQNGARILDLGCGGGRWVRRMLASQAKVFGTDINESVLKQNQKKWGSRFFVSDISKFAFKSESIDVVTDVTVVQHTDYPLQELTGQEVNRVVKDGGYWLLMEVIPSGNITSKEVQWDGIYPRSVAEWVKYLGSNGFKPERIFRLQFLPLTDFVWTTFQRLEKARKNLRTGYQQRMSSGSKSPLAAEVIKPKNTKSSWRLKFYIAIRTTSIDLVICLDFVLDFLFGNSMGSHIGILAKKKN